MSQSHTDLSAFSNDWYDPGAGLFKRLLWYFVNVLFFQNPANPVNGLKIFLLRLFGARLGKGLVIKPGVNIKYPWKLRIGNHCWLGEQVWIDNLAAVHIGDHVCLSQGAMLLTGSHNYKKSTFDLITHPIHLQDGVWIGAKAVVCPGVTCHTHAVLTAGSVTAKALTAYGIYQGNPAEMKRKRTISD